MGKSGKGENQKQLETNREHKPANQQPKLKGK